MTGPREGAADSCPSLVCTAGHVSGNRPFHNRHQPPVGLFPQIPDGDTDVTLHWASRALWRQQTGFGPHRHTCCVTLVSWCGILTYELAIARCES